MVSKVLVLTTVH